jgi:hypothetical protein
MTSYNKVKNWVMEAKMSGCEYAIIACDRFDHSDYLIKCRNADECREKIQEINKPDNMQRIMEIYDLSMPIQDQLNEYRALHLPKPKPLTSTN